MSLSTNSAVRRQDAELHQLFTREHARLERRLARIVNTSRENVEDALSFAWCALLRRRASIDMDDPAVWLLTVAKREAFKLHARSQRTGRLADHEHGGGRDLSAQRDPIAVREHLRDAVSAINRAGLSDRQRRLLVLHGCGFSYRELAQLEGASVRTVDRQLQHARRKLHPGGESRRRSGSIGISMLLGAASPSDRRPIRGYDTTRPRRRDARCGGCGHAETRGCVPDRPLVRCLARAELARGQWPCRRERCLTPARAVPSRMLAPWRVRGGRGTAPRPAGHEPRRNPLCVHAPRASRSARSGASATCSWSASRSGGFARARDGGNGSPPGRGFAPTAGETSC
jgi:RNA polymerase sigma factor (sigma-70 family)